MREFYLWGLLNSFVLILFIPTFMSFHLVFSYEDWTFLWRVYPLPEESNLLGWNILEWLSREIWAYYPPKLIIYNVRQTETNTEKQRERERGTKRETRDKRYRQRQEREAGTERRRDRKRKAKTERNRDRQGEVCVHK